MVMINVLVNTEQKTISKVTIVYNNYAYSSDA